MGLLEVAGDGLGVAGVRHLGVVSVVRAVRRSEELGKARTEGGSLQGTERQAGGQTEQHCRGESAVRRSIFKWKPPRLSAPTTARHVTGLTGLPLWESLNVPCQLSPTDDDSVRFYSRLLFGNMWGELMAFRRRGWSVLHDTTLVGPIIQQE